ncbi:MAG: efflux RND transporter permease subunit [Candidatus Methylacidiphilales bacterium]|nr:efflux RND transporter permease subunit [Candidatus Methylacidiphilales bacterium]
MNSISAPFIRRPVMTVLLTASAIVFGLMCYERLPVNDLPQTDFPVIQVNVGYPGASPETMANNIATPLEKQFMQIPGVDIITSKNTQGNTSISIQFKITKNLDAAATDVQAAISRSTGNLPVDLPSPPTFTKTNPNDQPVIYIGMTSLTLTPGQLYDYASTVVGQQISVLEGVSQVNVYGTKSAIRIQVDPSRLAALGLSLEDVSRAIKAGTSYQGAGQFDGPSRTFLLNPEGQLNSAKEYEQLIISNVNRAPVYLRDVAKCYDGVQDSRFTMRFYVRGGPPQAAGIVMAVQRAAGANTVAVAAAVKELLPKLRATLPDSIFMKPIYDRSLTIIRSVHEVQETLLIAFGLVVLVIYIFLGRATDTVIPAVTLPLSLLLTFIPMYLLSYSIDNLSLLALTLAIGFLVDDAIVFLENTVRRMEHGEDSYTAAFRSAEEISFTIVSMTLSLAAVFIPLVFMPGYIGRVFQEFSVTIILATFASGIVSLTLTPLMCAAMLAKRDVHQKSFMERMIGAVFNPMVRIYGNSLWFFLRHTWISVMVWLLCMVGTMYFLWVLPKSFMPVGDSGFIMGVLIAQEGSSPEKMLQIQSGADAVLKNNPHVSMGLTITGINMIATSQGLFLAFLDEKDKRPDINVVNGQLMGALMQIPGVMPGLRPNPVLEIPTGVASRNTGKYSLVISGINPDEVYGAADKMVKRIQALPGMGFVYSDVMRNTPELRINILREKASSYGVTATDIENTLRTAYSQNFIYLIKQPLDQYQLILEVKDKERREPEDLSLLYVKSSITGQLVPLKAVAEWKPRVGFQAVNHYNQFAAATINFDLGPTTPIGDATAAIEKIGQEILPSTMTMRFQGEAYVFRETVAGLGVLLIFAVFVMYVILGILYESYVHPITILASLPVAMVGGLATLYIFRMDVSLYGYVGLFMLMGIVKKNGIMIVDFALHRIDHGDDRVKAIHDACMDRFRPILMTTLAALMGAVPLAFSLGAADSTRQSLGYVIIGGLIVSQIITLYVNPAYFLILEAFQENILDRTKFFRSSRHKESIASTSGAAGTKKPALPADGRRTDNRAAGQDDDHEDGNGTNGSHLAHHGDGRKHGI